MRHGRALPVAVNLMFFVLLASFGVVFAVVFAFLSDEARVECNLKSNSGTFTGITLDADVGEDVDNFIPLKGVLEDVEDGEYIHHEPADVLVILSSSPSQLEGHDKVP